MHARIHRLMFLSNTSSIIKKKDEEGWSETWREVKGQLGEKLPTNERTLRNKLKPES